jgi:putative transposase
MGELKRSRHCVGGSNYHIQLTPKYRRRVFVPKHMRKLVEAIIRMKVHELGVKIGAIEFGPDHVHIFLTECRKYSVPELVQHIKGFSSYYLRKNYTEMVRPFLWGNAFWSGGYFYESIGRVTSETVKYYIERQQGKHWMHDNPETKVDAGGGPKTGQTRLDSFAA